MGTAGTPPITRVAGEQMPVNSYVVTGPSGLVVVDGQLTVSDADRVRRVIDGHDSRSPAWCSRTATRTRGAPADGLRGEPR